MFNLFNKLLNRSNSYKFYKSNYELLKKQLAESESQKKELKQIIDQNSEELKSFQETQKELQIKYNIKNEINVFRILQNISSLRKDFKNGKIINIVFIINFRLTVTDKLIEILEKDPQFNPTIVIIPFDTYGLNIFAKGLNKHQLTEYEENYQYFLERGFNVVKGYDPNLKTLIDLELELEPDIIFYSSPWETALPAEFQIKNLPENILFCYIPYGIHSSHMVDNQFNQELHKKAWKIFYPTQIHKLLAIKHADRGSCNVVVTGYPKMDPLLDGTHTENPYPWVDSTHEKKRIIWAPHHSIEFGISFSTFHENYQFFYDYAKHHPEIEWVFKPHPVLRNYHLLNPAVSSEDSPFNREKMEEYYDSWNELPNATVYEGGDYFNLFATSDAMITDSSSFLSEYLYSGHPGMFLTNNDQKFNEYGEIIIDAWYQIEGTDFDEIENFISNVVIQGEDPLKSIREDIFQRYLKTNGNPSEIIYNHIKNCLK